MVIAYCTCLIELRTSWKLWCVGQSQFWIMQYWHSLFIAFVSRPNCCMHFCSNVSCQHKPLLNLCHLILGLMPFQWLLFIALPRFKMQSKLGSCMLIGNCISHGSWAGQFRSILGGLFIFLNWSLHFSFQISEKCMYVYVCMYLQMQPKYRQQKSVGIE